MKVYGTAEIRQPTFIAALMLLQEAANERQLTFTSLRIFCSENLIQEFPSSIPVVKISCRTLDFLHSQCLLTANAFPSAERASISKLQAESVYGKLVLLYDYRGVSSNYRKRSNKTTIGSPRMCDKCFSEGCFSMTHSVQGWDITITEARRAVISLIRNVRVVGARYEEQSTEGV